MRRSPIERTIVATAALSDERLRKRRTTTCPRFSAASSGVAGLAGAAGFAVAFFVTVVLPEAVLETDVDFSTVAPLCVLVTVVFSRGCGAAVCGSGGGLGALCGRVRGLRGRLGLLRGVRETAHAGGRRERRIRAGIRLRAQRDEPDRAQERDRHQRDAERWGDLGHCPPHRLIGPIA